jgi:hypothetical protein
MKLDTRKENSTKRNMMYLTDECAAEIEQLQQEELRKLQALISKKKLIAIHQKRQQQLCKIKQRENNCTERIQDELWQKEQAGLNELLRVILEESEFTIDLS